MTLEISKPCIFFSFSKSKILTKVSFFFFFFFNLYFYSLPRHRYASAHPGRYLPQICLKFSALYRWTVVSWHRHAHLLAFSQVFLLSLVSLKTMGQDLAKKVKTLHLYCHNHKSIWALESKFRSMKTWALLKDGLYEGLSGSSESSYYLGHVPPGLSLSKAIRSSFSNQKRQSTPQLN